MVYSFTIEINPQKPVDTAVVYDHKGHSYCRWSFLSAFIMFAIYVFKHMIMFAADLCRASDDQWSHNPAESWFDVCVVFIEMKQMYCWSVFSIGEQVQIELQWAVSSWINQLSHRDHTSLNIHNMDITVLPNNNHPEKFLQLDVGILPVTHGMFQIGAALSRQRQWHNRMYSQVNDVSNPDGTWHSFLSI